MTMPRSRLIDMQIPGKVSQQAHRRKFSDSNREAADGKRKVDQIGMECLVRRFQTDPAPYCAPLIRCIVERSAVSSAGGVRGGEGSDGVIHACGCSIFFVAELSYETQR